MKRLVVSSLTAVCGLLLATTAHASFVEKSITADPQWKTQAEVDAEEQLRLDARTAVPNTEATREQEEERANDFNDTDSDNDTVEFGAKLRDVTINPAAPVTRAEFTAMLVRKEYPQADIDGCYWDITSVWPPRFELLFRDVPVDHPYAPEICIAMRDGLVRGYGNDIFRPESPLTFADAAKVSARAYGLTPWADPSTPKHWFDTYVNALGRRNAIPLSVQSIEERLTGEEAREILTRLSQDDRTKPSRDAQQLITDWEKKYEAPRVVVRAPARPTVPGALPSSSRGSSSSAKAATSSSLKPEAVSSAPAKSSAVPIIPTTGSGSSRPKAWYEF